MQKEFAIRMKIKGNTVPTNFELAAYLISVFAASDKTGDGWRITECEVDEHVDS